MTKDETIKGLNAVKEECGKHLDESFAWMCQPIDAAIETLKTEFCDDCVSRAELKDELMTALLDEKEYSYLCDVIDLLTPTRPQQKVGRWIEYVEPDDAEPLLQWRCDKCDTIERRKTHYCPNCGDKKSVE